MSIKDFPYCRAVPGISGLQPYQPGKPVEELERELGISNAVKLASNENPWGTSPLVLAAIRERTDIALYPDANGYYLKAALADRLDVDASWITLGNGSNDVLDLVARTFVGPGDEVIFSEYAFLVYALVAAAAGGVPVVTPSVGWGHHIAAMSAAVTEKTKLVFLANPNNPTGTYICEQDLRLFMAEVSPQVVVVIDEAYFEYVEVDDYPDCMRWLDDYPNLIVSRTFSKIHGLASLRVGYGVASPQITDLMNRVRQPFNVNTMAQATAIAALEDNEHVDRCRRENVLQMGRLTDFCMAHSLNYIPSVANFVTVEFGEETGKIYQALLRMGIILRPLENYGMPHHLRITVGRDQEMDQLFNALERILS